MITDLCVMDWNGPQHMLQLISLHPGISVEQVLDNTGFEVQVPAQVPTTAAPTPLQMEIIGQMDPLNLRARQLKDNPPGDRR